MSAARDSAMRQIRNALAAMVGVVLVAGSFYTIGHEQGAQISGARDALAASEAWQTNAARWERISRGYQKLAEDCVEREHQRMEKP